MGNLFAELKRRHIYRVAAAYAVVAWVLVQIVNNLAPIFDLPAWIARAVVLLLIVGLPITLLIAWMRELAPADGTPARAVTSKLDWALMGALVVLIVGGAYQQLTLTSGARTEQQASVATARKAAASPVNVVAIAALPFAKFTMDVAPADALGTNLTAIFYNRPSRTAFAISPDGATIVFVGEVKVPSGTPTSMLYRRPLSEFRAVAIPGTDGAEYPFFSPDGQWVGFGAGNKLKKVALSGGPPIDICDFMFAGRIEGASWGPTGAIAFARRGLWTVSDSGGKPDAPFEHDPNTRLYSPHMLPDGQTVLFTEVAGSRWEDAHVDAINLTTKQRKTLLTNAADARYSPTGHLAFVRNAALLAVPFDATRVEVTGAPVPLLAGIMQSTNAPNGGEETGMGQFALSASGILIYASGDGYPVPTTTLVRVDRKGAETKLAAEISGALGGLRLSSSGSRVVAFKTQDGSRASDIWMYDLPFGTPTRLTSTGDASWPLFSLDGKSITYDKRGSNPGIYSLPLNDNNAPQRMMESKLSVLDLVAASWSSDGKWLAYVQTVGNVRQIFVRAVRDSKLDAGEPHQFSPSTFPQQGAEFSPDSRWIAYSSNESGAEEVYVQPFPGPGEKHRISSNGGINPAWSRSGRELFYFAAKPGTRTRRMMAVDFSTAGDFKASDPHLLFEGPYATAIPLRSYDVTPNGQFIMSRTENPPDQAVTNLNVVIGWGEELKRRVPTK
jgi:eukaryotic-like serine/threonine-protein kinase